MSQLVALCFDADASPSLRFQSSRNLDATPLRGEAEAVYGWGVGWYPGSERGASVVKDPTSSGETSVSDALGDWDRFRSTLFVCHLRGHRRPRSQQEAQPFVRSYGGRQWVFAHDGDLAEGWAQRFPLGDDPAFEPLGRTDSEHAFCWLLSKLRERRARAVADVPPDLLQSWMRQLNEGGELNALLTDGEDLVAYHDAFRDAELHWMRRIPPHESTELSSEAIRITLDAPEDPNRTAVVFSTLPLSEKGWTPASRGELLIVRRGTIVWSSHRDVQLEGRTAPIAGVPAGRVEAAFQPTAAAPLVVAPGSKEAPGGASHLLRVVHSTRYAYDNPVERSSHRLLLRPVEDRVQQLVDYSILIDPAVNVMEYDDVFGNAALAVEIGNPFSVLEIEMTCLVRLHATRSLERRAAHQNVVIPLVWMPWQRQMLSAYLLPPELPESQLQELSEFAMTFVERNDYDLVGTLLDLNQTLYRDFEYVSGSTTHETTPFEVFESRRGVCQDFANLMICLARLLHVPARYRMGYIFTGADYENRIQSEASHAWVELYLPRVGWHGFDPTNGIQVGSDHVRVACGRIYSDATPTSGTIYRGGGLETLTISVRVEEVEG